MSFSCIVFRYCLAFSHLSKVNSPLIPEKKIEGKQKLLRKIYYLSVGVDLLDKQGDLLTA